jgi:hypothetical protein
MEERERGVRVRGRRVRVKKEMAAWVTTSQEPNRC